MSTSFHKLLLLYYAFVHSHLTYGIVASGSIYKKQDPHKAMRLELSVISIREFLEINSFGNLEFQQEFLSLILNRSNQH